LILDTASRQIVTGFWFFPIQISPDKRSERIMNQKGIINDSPPVYSGYLKTVFANYYGNTKYCVNHKSGWQICLQHVIFP